MISYILIQKKNPKNSLKIQANVHSDALMHGSHIVGTRAAAVARTSPEEQENNSSTGAGADMGSRLHIMANVGLPALQFNSALIWPLCNPCQDQHIQLY